DQSATVRTDWRSGKSGHPLWRIRFPRKIIVKTGASSMRLFYFRALPRTASFFSSLTAIMAYPVYALKAVLLLQPTRIWLC
ncbi:hypothetical protein N7568_22830, partial [Paenarthrobacter aurescens]|nr:hypothetical protein [Paenarthrobacter aurescens]